ncbi:MAG: FAD-binding protein [Spirochaetales bacterium]|nr:FAD-binding protein [Spirochaetales bacterium]
MERDVSLRLPPAMAYDESQIRKALGIGPDEKFIIVRRSVDARRKDIVIDLVCRIDPQKPLAEGMALRDADPAKGQVIIVGSGPAGLFAALTLLEMGKKPIVLERGKDVHSRRQDIARISTQDIVNSESNYSFGEGGAGTYSDGKLYTRSKKRGENSKVLGTFVQFGADESILCDAHPHIGTDKLPKIIEAMRNAIISHGGEVRFRTKVTDLIISENRCTGVVAKDMATDTELTLRGPVILAIGNAARDTFRMLNEKNVRLEAKSLAMGVRLEHPQNLIDRIQYHNADGRGKYLPAAEYSFTTQVEVEGRRLGVYSFCMCPGGFVVPAASDRNQVVVNGMSPSNRGSKWANSGMVVEFPTDMLSDSTDPLAMMKLQEELEKKTYDASDCTQKAPSQRLTDFMEHRLSQSTAPSSYAPGLTCSNIWDVLPTFACQALHDGFATFSRQAHGFMTEEATLIGTETRTSSPIRITRNPETLESISTKNLFPCGEGAGYAGGIVSAAIDGMRCAQMAGRSF